MGAFYGGIVPTTKALEAYVTRGLAKSIAWAPSRMIDAAEEMLGSWQRNDTDSTTTKPANMPVILVAMAKDYVPTGRDFTRQVADRIMVTIPDDEKGRVFGLRTVAGDIRAQIAIFAHDEPSARSIAAQFLLFLDAAPNRWFMARYTFAGQIMEWPVQVESPDSPAMAIQTDAKNLTILAVDLTLKAEIPMFDAPAAGQPNDGQGTPGTSDPAGYPLVQGISLAEFEQGAGPLGGAAAIRSSTINQQEAP